MINTILVMINSCYWWFINGRFILLIIYQYFNKGLQIFLFLINQVDENVGCAEKERLSRLELENKALRELLEICTTSKERIIHIEPKFEIKKEEEVDDDDETTDTEGDSSVLLAPDKTEEPDKKETPDKKKSVSGSRETTPTGAGTKAVGASKSLGDIRKGKTSPTIVSPTVKKATSVTGIKKDNVVKKSPSIEAKKDLKPKTVVKTVTKK